MIKKPNLFFIYLTVFVNIIGFGMVFPLLPFYARHFNASEATVGLLAASFAISQFLLSPIWGRLSDRFGRKPIISIALVGLSFAFLLFGLADNLFWLFIGRILQGAFSAASIPVAQAYVADVTTKEERIKGMGKLGASLALGFIFGPALGGLLSSFNLSFPFFIASIVALLNFVSVRIFLPESLSQKAEKLMIKEGFFNIKQMYRGLKGEMGSLFILIFLWSFALTNNEVAVPLFGSEKLNLSATSIGLIFSMMGFLSASVQFFFLHKITSVLGEHKTSVLGLFFMAVSLYLVPFSPNLIFLATSLIFMALGSSMARPTIATLISKETKEGQGTTMGLMSAFESSGRIFGPLLGGWLFSTFGYHSPFSISAVLILITLFFVVTMNKFFPSGVKGFFRN